jgi:hypothetical protein
VQRTATCACGNCAITAKGDPTLYGICNCDNCKARTGSGFGWNAYFPDAQVGAMTGDFSEYELTKPCLQTRYFCARCGTTLCWRSAFMAGHMGIAAGCFTTTPLPEPTGLYAADQACSWLSFPDSWDRVS